MRKVMEENEQPIALYINKGNNPKQQQEEVPVVNDSNQQQEDKQKQEEEEECENDGQPSFVPLCDGYLCMEHVLNNSNENENVSIKKKKTTTNLFSSSKRLWKQKDEQEEQEYSRPGSGTFVWKYCILQSDFKLSLYSTDLINNNLKQDQVYDLQVTEHEMFFSTEGLMLHIQIHPNGNNNEEQPQQSSNTLTLYASNRSELVRWVTAFHRLHHLWPSSRSSKRRSSTLSGTDLTVEDETSEEEELEIEEQEENNNQTLKKTLSFQEKARVTIIPAFTEKEKKDLFYSKEDIQRFTNHATSKTRQFFCKYFQR